MDLKNYYYYYYIYILTSFVDVVDSSGGELIEFLTGFTRSSSVSSDDAKRLTGLAGSVSGVSADSS